VIAPVRDPDERERRPLTVAAFRARRRARRRAALLDVRDPDTRESGLDDATLAELATARPLAPEERCPHTARPGLVRSACSQCAGVAVERAAAPPPRRAAGAPIADLDLGDDDDDGPAPRARHDVDVASLSPADLVTAAAAAARLGVSVGRVFQLVAKGALASAQAPAGSPRRRGRGRPPRLIVRADLKRLIAERAAPRPRAESWQSSLASAVRERGLVDREMGSHGARGGEVRARRREREAQAAERAAAQAAERAAAQAAKREARAVERARRDEVERERRAAEREARVAEREARAVERAAALAAEREARAAERAAEREARAAERAAEREARAARPRERGGPRRSSEPVPLPPGHEHGTSAAYVMARCSCRPCKQWNTSRHHRPTTTTTITETEQTAA
jgi:hypothetical protein